MTVTQDSLLTRGDKSSIDDNSKSRDLNNISESGAHLSDRSNNYRGSIRKSPHSRSRQAKKDGERNF